MGSMNHEFPYPFHFVRKTFATTLSIALLSVFGIPFSSFGQSAPKNEPSKEREIHNTFSSDQNNGSLLDATNPMELINRLRKATAMDDATSPSDAIDQALRALDEQEDLEESSAGLNNSSESSTLSVGFDKEN